MLKHIFAVLLAALLSCAASAQSPIPAFPPGAFQNRAAHDPASASYTGPGDITTFTAWWGFRAYSAAKAGTKAARLVRASDSTQQDINTLANGNFDTASAATFCNATTCKVVTLYDQTGNTFDQTQSTDGLRPAYTASCVSSKPCMTLSGTAVAANNGLVNSAIGTVAQIYSMSAVTQRTSVGSTDCILCTNGANDDLAFHGSGFATIIWGSAFVDAAAAENTWHALQAVANGASSTLTVDGSTTTGSPGSGSAAGDYTIGSNTSGFNSNSLTGTIAEIGFKSGDMTSVIASINSNQRAYWGF